MMDNQQDELKLNENQEPAMESLEADKEEGQEKDVLLQLAERIREQAAAIKLVRYQQLEQAVISEEESMEPVSVELLLEQLLAHPDYQDICCAKGKNEQFYYSDRYISNSYAAMLVNIEEGDLLELVASTVRRESKIYPRPTDCRIFYKAPFHFTQETFPQIMEKIKGEEDYQDIQEVYASNGATYLHSVLHLSRPYAKSLAEWIEVERFEAP